MRRAKTVFRFKQKEDISTDYFDDKWDYEKSQSNKSRKYLNRSMKFNSKSFQIKKNMFESVKKEIERKDLQRKFLFLYRHKINKIYQNLIIEKEQEIVYTKNRARNWVIEIMLFKISKYTKAKFNVKFIDI